MSLLTERVTFRWFLQAYSGLKVFQYLAALAIVPREIQLGRPLKMLVPFNEIDLAWRIGIRLLMLVAWLLICLWAGGELWPANQKAET